MTVADALGLCSPQLPPGMLSLLLSGEREPGQLWGGFHGPRGPGEPTAKTRALSASAAGHGTAGRVGARGLAGFPGPGRWQRLKRDSRIAKNLVSTHASGDTDGPCSKGHPSVPHRLGCSRRRRLRLTGRTPPVAQNAGARAVPSDGSRERSAPGPCPHLSRPPPPSSAQTSSPAGQRSLDWGA